jgi:hypothetical protein
MDERLPLVDKFYKCIYLPELISPTFNDNNKVFRENINQTVDSLYSPLTDYQKGDEFRGVEANVIMDQLENVDMNDDDIYGQARTPIRYAAIRSVWATPTVFINNATDVPIDHNSRLADWKSVIDPLLAS